MKEVVLLTVLCTFLQFRQFNTFSIQKRRAQTHSDLKNALAVLQRKRRRIDDSDIRNRLYGDLSNPYLPYDEYIPYRDEYNSVNEDGNENLADQYVLANMLNTYPEQFASDVDKDEDQPSEKETPTVGELKAIFDQIDKNDATPEETATEQSDKSNNKISQQQMDQLLSEAVKVPSDSANSLEEKNSNDHSPKPVSQDELKDVFKETAAKEQLTDGQKEKIETLNQEYINSDLSNSLSEKKKRMAKRDNNSDKIAEENTDETILNLVQQVQELQNKVAQLQLVEYLEDKENDYLASALKDATLAQLRNTEAYLEVEYNDIQKALQIEQVLQDIKDPDEEEEEEEETDLQPANEKRSEPPFEDNLGLWYDEPVQDQGDAQQKLEDFVKQYRQTYDLDNPNGISEPETLQEEAQDIPFDGEVCPQLDMLTSNCQVADMLDIDDEARDLCSRHEVCYICGVTVGLSQHDCDAGFRSETVERCATSHCIQSGAEFLWFIKQDHKYTNAYLEQCDAPCVKKYIVGV